MAKAAPRVYSIAPGEPFLEHLAAAIANGFPGPAGQKPDAAALASWRIVLPTRRAVRSLSHALLRASHAEALLLPRIEAIGDMDEEEMLFQNREPPPGERHGAVEAAISPVERQFILTRLIAQQAADLRREIHGETEPQSFARLTPAQAAALARTLIRLLDMLDTEQVCLSRIATLVAEDFARNWQLTLDFLKVVTRTLPALLAERGLLTAMQRRNRLIEAQTAFLERHGSDRPLIAAGSTGSIPATAKLLKAIAGLENGAVVLPGLDMSLDDRSWDTLDAGHPQYGLKALLDQIGITRGEVLPLPGAPRIAAERVARARLISLAMLPAETTGQWRRMCDDMRTQIDAATGGLHLVAATSPHHEALIIAAIMREAIETPGKTAALVTPDRRLARQVAAHLERWDILVDDSAGIALSRTRPCTLMQLIADTLADDFAPVGLLALLKHPLARFGLSAGSMRARARVVELAALRGLRPAAGIEGLRRALSATRDKWSAGKKTRHLHPALIRLTETDFDNAEELLTRLADATAPFAALFADARRRPFEEVLKAHIAAAEAIGEGEDEPGDQRLWRGDHGEAVANALNELLEHASRSPDVARDEYPAYFRTLLQAGRVRPRHSRHPRLAIWGPLEARLQSADRMILAGLNEGTWPQRIVLDAWLNRPMRGELGLEPPERSHGLAAHDFAQGACAREVFLTRAQKVDGSPSVASRWLQRLAAVLDALARLDRVDRSTHWRMIAERMETPDRSWTIAAPRPAPPLAARPRQLSVTRIETLRRDPYAIYASCILGLRPLDPLDQDIDAALRGQIIHEVLHRFTERTPGELPADALEILIGTGREVFARHMDRPAAAAFWWPRFKRMARWFIDLERTLRHGVAAQHGEVRGLLRFDAPGGEFTLTAIADRIDVLQDGALRIYDYKTGAAPGQIDIDRQLSPQLTLEAAIAAARGFERLAGGPVEALRYVRVTGGSPPGELVDRSGGNADAAGEAALAALKTMIAHYDDAAHPYLSRQQVKDKKRDHPFDHLARYREWSVQRGQADRP